MAKITVEIDGEQVEIESTRNRRYICECQTHIVNAAAGVSKPGPYVLYMAGSGAVVQCFYCQTFFQQVDANRGHNKRRGGCAHCSNPEAHTHTDEQE